MNIAPMQLEMYFITDFHLTAQRKYKPEKAQKYTVENLQTDIKFLTNKQYPNVWQVPMTLKYQPQPNENLPYGFDLRLVGFFKINATYPKNRINALIHYNAPAILYSTAREIVALMTGRGPWGHILLPSVNFLDILKKPITKRRKHKTVHTNNTN